jgi:cytosine/creatinine deaminase
MTCTERTASSDALTRASEPEEKPACTLYTTLSPCPMCTGASLLYGIPKVEIGENTSFMGEEDLLRSNGVIVEVVYDPLCIDMMSRFIKSSPELWNEGIGV